VEDDKPPLSAREVASMSFGTSAGKATVTQACEVFGISRAGYYEAKKALCVVAKPTLTLIEGGATSAPPYDGAEKVKAAIRAIVDATRRGASARSGRRCVGRRMASRSCTGAYTH